MYLRGDEVQGLQHAPSRHAVSREWQTIWGLSSQILQDRLGFRDDAGPDIERRYFALPVDERVILAIAERLAVFTSFDLYKVEVKPGVPCGDMRSKRTCGRDVIELHHLSSPELNREVLGKCHPRGAVPAD